MICEDFKCFELVFFWFAGIVAHQEYLQRLPEMQELRPANRLLLHLVWVRDVHTLRAAQRPCNPNSRLNDAADLCSYYGLWMWFPELFNRMEEGGSPCSNVSLPSHLAQNHSCYPVKTAGVYQ